MSSATRHALNQLTEIQLQRQLADAVRLSLMTGAERSDWLAENWDTVQRRGNSLLAGMRLVEPGAVCFESLAQKNAYDESLALRAAVALHKATR